MLEVNHEKSRVEIKDPHLIELNCRALYKTSMDDNYINNCIENVAKRCEKKNLTKFITYAREGILITFSFKQSCIQGCQLTWKNWSLSNKKKTGNLNKKPGQIKNF